MAGNAFPALDATYDILIRDADGQHLELESYTDLTTARRRLPSLAAQYPGPKLLFGIAIRAPFWRRLTATELSASAFPCSTALSALLPSGSAHFFDSMY